MNGNALVLILVIALASVCAQNCSSPVFAQANAYFSAPVFSPVDPTPANNMCPGLEGKPSCCPKATLDAMESAWNTFFREYAQAQVALSAGVKEIARNVQAAFDEVEDGIRRNDGIPDDVKDRLIALFRELNGSYQTFLGSYTDALIKCLNRVLRYVIGVICLSCSEEWATYIRASAGVRFLLADSVCTDLKESCSDLVNLYFNLYTSVNQTMYEFHVDTGASGPYRAPMANPCRNAPEPGNCDSYTCDRLVRGLNPDLSDLSLSDSSRMLRDIVAHHAGADAAAHVDAMDAAFTALEKHRAEYQRVVESARDDAVGNDYDSNGYDAIKVGDESKVQASLESSAAALPSLFTLF